MRPDHRLFLQRRGRPRNRRGTGRGPSPNRSTSRKICRSPAASARLHLRPTTSSSRGPRSKRTELSSAVSFCTPSRSLFPRFSASMPEVMIHVAPMHKENKGHDEQHHEEIVFSDHDALLLPLPFPKFTVPLWEQG